MNKSIKILLGLVAILVVIVTGIVINNNSLNNSSGNEDKLVKPTVTIGITLPLTGDVAILGESAQNAIILAKEQLKDTKYDYKLVFENDQFKPTLGATIANKLISVDKADALMSFGSPVGHVVSIIAEKSKIPHVNAFASDDHVADGEYNFLDYTPAYEDSKLFIQELQKRNVKKLVFFGQQDNPGALAIINAFEKDVKGTGITVLASEKFNTGTRDFRSQIDQIKNLGADIIVLEASTPELEILARQIKQAGIKTPLTTMEAFEFSDQLSLFEGNWYVNGADPSQWFLDQYKNRFGKDAKFGAANQYDGFNLIVQAVETAGDGKTVPTKEQIKNALSQIKSFNGALGENLSIDENGLVVSKAVIRIIKDGKPVTVK
ncbi:MAG: ABC transporter substrate-binding protein [bacterium]